MESELASTIGQVANDRTMQRNLPTYVIPMTSQPSLMQALSASAFLGSSQLCDGRHPELTYGQ